MQRNVELQKQLHVHMQASLQTLCHSTSTTQISAGFSICCSAVREAAMQCIEELHEQLGQPVLDGVAALHVKPAQLKELHARLGHLQASARAVQDYPLFQPVTAMLTRPCSGSNTSRSDCSNQVPRKHLVPYNALLTDPVSAASTSPGYSPGMAFEQAAGQQARQIHPCHSASSYAL